MSMSSINRNNEAIRNLEIAIEKYEDAISMINSKNKNNQKSDEIVSLMRNAISEMKGIESELKRINSRIKSELDRIKREEAEKWKKK